MNSKGFFVALIIGLSLLVYSGQSYLFFSDYLMFMIVFALASLIVSIAAVLSKTIELSPPEEYSADDRAKQQAGVQRRG
ncbi:hypothetical protein KVP09_08275 [Alcaligenaceae bacterium CGII-47]|nr:hypothetical protein [Alcaligenaceae bacterium CGII-47]